MATFFVSQILSYSAVLLQRFSEAQRLPDAVSLLGQTAPISVFSQSCPFATY